MSESKSDPKTADVRAVTVAQLRQLITDAQELAKGTQIADKGGLTALAKQAPDAAEMDTCPPAFTERLFGVQLLGPSGGVKLLVYLATPL